MSCQSGAGICLPECRGNGNRADRVAAAIFLERDEQGGVNQILSFMAKLTTRIKGQEFTHEALAVGELQHRAPVFVGPSQRIRAGSSGESATGLEEVVIRH